MATRLLAHERWQMATDVHDLIMQDLSLALANARALGDDPALRRVPASSSAPWNVRSRAPATCWADSPSTTPGRSRRRSRSACAPPRATRRCGSTPRACPPRRNPTSRRATALVHIAREAVTNAVKHARPNAIEVVLEHAGPVAADGARRRPRLRRSPGSWPPPSAASGLLSMRESAHALGGAVHVGSANGAGTTVEAVLP